MIINTPSVPVAAIQVRTDNDKDVERFLISEQACDCGMNYGKDGELTEVSIGVGETEFVAHVGNMIVAFPDGSYRPMTMDDYETMVAELIEKGPY